MKRYISFVLFVVMVFSCCMLPANAVEGETAVNSSIDLPVVGALSDNNRATGLIGSYDLVLSKTGTTLNITAKLYCIPDVVKCGFKNLIIERRASSSSSWSEYYDYGDLYIDAYTAIYNAVIVVPSGYQYRLSCKHYAKKSLFVTQNISQTSNIVTVQG